MICGMWFVVVVGIVGYIDIILYWYNPIYNTIIYIILYIILLWYNRL